MRKIVISGGPSTGKSTTFELLREAYPDAHFVEEAAEQVIKNELMRQADDPSYTPVMPTTNYPEFTPLVMAGQIANEQKIPKTSKLVFLDRCLIDNLGYLAYNGIEQHIHEVHRYTRAANYSLAFFCDWLGKFERTEIRRETAAEGYAIHQHLEAAYHSSDLPVIHLPAVSTEERLEIIRSTLDEFSTKNP
jgi:predicted ATPase